LATWELGFNPFAPAELLLFEPVLWDWARQPGKAIVVLLPEEEPSWCTPNTETGSPGERLAVVLLGKRMAVERMAHLRPSDIESTSFAVAQDWRNSPGLLGRTALALPGTKKRHPLPGAPAVEAMLESAGGSSARTSPAPMSLGKGMPPPKWYGALDEFRKLRGPAFDAIDGMSGVQLLLRCAETPEVGLAMGARVGEGALFVLFARVPASNEEAEAIVTCMARIVGSRPLDPPGHPPLPWDIVAKGKAGAEDGGTIQLEGTSVHGRPYPGISLGEDEFRFLTCLHDAMKEDESATTARPVPHKDLMWRVYNRAAIGPPVAKPDTIPVYKELHTLKARVCKKLTGAGVDERWIDEHLHNIRGEGYVLLRSPQSPPPKPPGA
jgi:hypothetical protein